MEREKESVLISKNYKNIDGRNAYNSNIKSITLGKAVKKENKNMKIAIQAWDNNENLLFEIPIHQVIDLMILQSEALLYFKEAYRMPLLYNPKNPNIEKIGLQGDGMDISVNMENENIDEDIKYYQQALSDLGEITGERLRVLSNILKELEY